jgi:hypothetical protein
MPARKKSEPSSEEPTETPPSEDEAPPEFLNRAARRAQGKGKKPKAPGKITPSHHAAVHSPRQWANRRSG